MMLNALGKTKTILKASIATMVANLVLDLALYPVLGLIGPAIATLVSVAVMNMYQLYLSKKEIGVKFIDIYPIKTVVGILGLNALMGCSVWAIYNQLLKRLSINPTLLAIMIGVVWLGLYLAIIWKKIASAWSYLNNGEHKND